MSTAEWALVVSIFALTISFGNFVWSVWSKFIHPKPKLYVNIAIYSLLDKSPKSPEKPDFISLSATNHGPSEITLHSAIVRKKYNPFKKRYLGLLNPLNDFPFRFDTTNGPFSGGLPKKIGVGEQFSVYFPISKKWTEDGLAHFGFSDTFGRKHWCSRKASYKLIEDIKKHPNSEVQIAT